MNTDNVNKIVAKAQEVVALIEPLDDLEQMAVLDLASTFRGFNRATRAREVPQEVAVSDPQLPA